MKVFISWSGDYSKNIAEILRQWIPAVIQAVKPYYTPDDITKGTRWSSDISRELDQSKIGIICLTKDNLKSPWIMFEAGALSKKMEESKVVPLLFGIEPTDIEGPLVQFQAATFSKVEMKKTVAMMNNELGEAGLADEVLESVFEVWWPKLEIKIDSIKQETIITDNKGSRTERDLLEEVLSLTRELAINQGAIDQKGTKIRVRPWNEPPIIRDLLVGIEGLIALIFSKRGLASRTNIERLRKAINHMYKHPSKYDDSVIEKSLSMILSNLTSLEDLSEQDTEMIRDMQNPYYNISQG